MYTPMNDSKYDMWQKNNYKTKINQQKYIDALGTNYSMWQTFFNFNYRL